MTVVQQGKASVAAVFAALGIGYSSTWAESLLDVGMETVKAVNGEGVEVFGEVSRFGFYSVWVESEAGHRINLAAGRDIFSDGTAITAECVGAPSGMHAKGWGPKESPNGPADDYGLSKGQTTPLAGDGYVKGFATLKSSADYLEPVLSEIRALADGVSATFGAISSRLTSLESRNDSEQQDEGDSGDDYPDACDDNSGYVGVSTALGGQSGMFPVHSTVTTTTHYATRPQ